MSQLSSMSVTGLLEAFASSAPTPGGGSAAALIGAVGASLLSMVAAMPKTRTGAPDERAALEEAHAGLETLRHALTDLIDRDTDAYDLVVAAYRKPKATEADKAERASAIQHALRVATEVPAETFKACADALRLAVPVARHGNPNAKSDVGVAVQALSTGMQGALFNVEINITSVKDPAVVEAITAELRSAGEQTRAHMAEVFKEAGFMELMTSAATRLGTSHGAMPEPGTPEHRQRVGQAVASLLRQLQAPECRQSLTALAASADDAIAGPARRALDQFDGPTA